MKEAKLVKTEAGLAPEGPGWFVVNVHEAAWGHNEWFGKWVDFEGEGEAKFSHYGINIHVIQPGQANCYYHRESAQEDFLVLAGKCKVLIEEEEHELGPWDFVHCPPGTTHVFVGAGDGPCAILMAGARFEGIEITYPESELALKHEAGVKKTTHEPKVAYEGRPKSTRVACPVRLESKIE